MNLFAAKRYIPYFFKAKSNLRLHSPSVFKWYTAFKAYSIPQEIKDQLISYKEALSKQEADIQTIASIDDKKEIIWDTNKISRVSSNISISMTYARLLVFLIEYFNCKQVLELGTGLGVGTMCMALANKEAKVTSIDANPQFTSWVQARLIERTIYNFKLVTGKFEEQLSPTLSEIPQLDLVYFDGHHQYEATLQYFDACLEKAHNDSVFVFDDINWSEGMYKAWQAIKAHPRVTTSVDFYRMGVVFFNDEVKVKQEFVLKV